jgi:hypothetical protein
MAYLVSEHTITGVAADGPLLDPFPEDLYVQSVDNFPIYESVHRRSYKNNSTYSGEYVPQYRSKICTAQVQTEFIYRVFHLKRNSNFYT